LLLIDLVGGSQASRVIAVENRDRNVTLAYLMVSAMSKMIEWTWLVDCCTLRDIWDSIRVLAEIKIALPACNLPFTVISV